MKNLLKYLKEHMFEYLAILIIVGAFGCFFRGEYIRAIIQIIIGVLMFIITVDFDDADINTTVVNENN